YRGGGGPKYPVIQRVGKPKVILTIERKCASNTAVIGRERDTLGGDQAVGRVRAAAAVEVGLADHQIGYGLLIGGNIERLAKAQNTSVTAVHDVEIAGQSSKSRRSAKTSGARRTGAIDRGGVLVQLPDHAIRRLAIVKCKCVLPGEDTVVLGIAYI